LRHLLIDFDPVRPADISSTDEEHQAALDRRVQVRDFWVACGLPPPVEADSGNGAHLIPRLADLENTNANVALLQKTLQMLDQLFSDSRVKVDLTTFNPARICKLYGTICRKGSNTADRPHRLSRLIEVPEGYHENRVTQTQLQAFVDEYFVEPETTGPSDSQSQSQSSPRRGSTGPLDIEKLLQERGIQYTKRPWGAGSKFILQPCLFNPDHTGSSAAIIQLASGALKYSCLHDGCVEKTWHAARDILDPGWREGPVDSHSANSKPSEPSASGGDVFKSAPTVPEFLAQSDAADGTLVAGGLLVRSGTSLVAAPRGIGKTLVAMKLAIAASNGGEFCGEVLPRSRVLYCAYENSPAILRDRLTRLGGAESENLRILTRSKAPKLQSDEWHSFPVEDFDFIIIDSLSPALEGGIDERQGGQNSDALAALLNIVQRGPGALLIANTTKTASSIRGSGILSDRADLVFEVRDATDFKPNPKHEVWWDAWWRIRAKMRGPDERAAGVGRRSSGSLSSHRRRVSGRSWNRASWKSICPPTSRGLSTM